MLRSQKSGKLLMRFSWLELKIIAQNPQQEEEDRKNLRSTE